MTKYNFQRKKNLLILFLILSAIIFLVGCSNKATNNDLSSERDKIAESQNIMD